jgi:meiotically up-regulated gene 157 (Mug157) protein
MALMVQVGNCAVQSASPRSVAPLHAQALTSDSDDEIMQCLETLKASSANTGLMHGAAARNAHRISAPPRPHVPASARAESFWRDDVSRYTRSWFAWANGLFGTLILTLARERPHLIFN